MMNTQALFLTALVAFSASPALADTATPMPTKQTMAVLHDRNCTKKTVQTYQLDGSIVDAVRGPVVHPVMKTRTTCAISPASALSHMSNVAAPMPTAAEPK